MITVETLRETTLNINFGINNESQYYKIGTVGGGVLMEWGRVNGGDEGKGIWLMDFIYIYKIE
jgi:hypothetical protein